MVTYLHLWHHFQRIWCILLPPNQACVWCTDIQVVKSPIHINKNLKRNKINFFYNQVKKEKLKISVELIHLLCYKATEKEQSVCAQVPMEAQEVWDPLQLEPPPECWNWTRVLWRSTCALSYGVISPAPEQHVIPQSALSWVWCLLAIPTLRGWDRRFAKSSKPGRVRPCLHHLYPNL